MKKTSPTAFLPAIINWGAKIKSIPKEYEKDYEFSICNKNKSFIEMQYLCRIPIKEQQEQQQDFFQSLSSKSEFLEIVRQLLLL